MKLASRISRLETSRTLQVKEKALELKSRGVEVLDLTVGEPDFPTPAYVCNAGVEAIQSGFTKYTANDGIPELKEAVARKLKNDNGLQYSPRQIIISNGAKQSVMNALFTLVNPGDDVLLPLPYWVSYPEQIKMAGGNPILVDTTQNYFKIEPELLERHLTPQAKGLILNSPCNPTGVVVSRDELAALADFLQRKDLWVITDEIYEKIIFDGRKHVSIASLDGMAERCIVVNGLSKSYAMTGWRIGYAAGPLPVIKGMSKIQGHYTSNACSISQKAALAALKNSQESIEKMRRTFEKRRNYIKDVLDGCRHLKYVYPQGAFYFFINISEAFGSRYQGERIDDSVKFCSYLTENHHLLTVPGTAFGADEYIRVSFAASIEQIEEAMKRLVNGMSQLVESKMEIE